jgi:hypothetical protein
MKIEMEHFNFSTGSNKADYFLLGISWLFAGLTWQAIPVILSSVASLCVIANQVIIYKNRKQTKSNG